MNLSDLRPSMETLSVPVMKVRKYFSARDRGCAEMPM